jgi:hypothetical protein
MKEVIWGQAAKSCYAKLLMVTHDVELCATCTQWQNFCVCPPLKLKSPWTEIPLLHVITSNNYLLLLRTKQ